MHVQRTAEASASAVSPVKPYRVAQIATLLDVHQATVYRDIEAGRLKALRVGTGKGALRIMPDAYAAYLAQLEARAVSEFEPVSVG
jgi:excisionase family DNA binding protein